MLLCVYTLNSNHVRPQSMNLSNDVLNQAYTLLTEESATSWLAISILSLILALLLKFLILIASKTLRKLAEKTSSIWDDIVVDLLDGLKKWVMFIFIFYFLVHYFRPTAGENRLLFVAFVGALAFQIALWGLHIIKNWRHNVLDNFIQKDPSSSAGLGLLYTVIQVAFLTLIVLIGLSNMGVNISALIAGLGVGGIAVALAAQNVLGDLLASLSIVIDKPFIIGDFIVTGDDKGTVEHIGIKTTRLRSLSGEQLIFSNKDLLESRVKNFKRMLERRVVLKFGVIYATKSEVLEKIPTWVKQFVEKHKNLRFDRCHFDTFAASSLDFELVFYVLDAEFNVYMDIKQIVLLDIFKKFASEGIEFAFPSYSLYFDKKAETPN
jgi:small-conductance mechanosensitive channel